VAEFHYKAVKRDGTMTEGYVAADTLDMASRQVRNQGLVLVQMSPSSVGSAAIVASGAPEKPPTRDNILSFTSELSVLLRAGLPIDRALKVLIDMSGTPAMTSLQEDLLKTVKGGKGLSQAMQVHEAHFGHFYINMIRSGEASGRLAEVLARLADYLKRAKAVRASVVSALIYPAILAVVALLSIVVMLGFVVPQFEALFADLGDALPLLTQMVVVAGNAIKAYGWIMLAVLIPLVFAVRRWLATADGQVWLDKKLLALPVLGELVFKYEVGRFSRTLGTLLGNGVSLLQSISIAINTVDNSIVRKAFDGLAPAVKQGGRISTALSEAKMFSPMVVQMVRVGEESGSLDNMMLELAMVYDDEVQAGVKRALTLLEPLLILGMGAVIAIIIIAILMGILSVNDLAV
jgi:general secretion pathway protein F